MIAPTNDFVNLKALTQCSIDMELGKLSNLWVEDATGLVWVRRRRRVAAVRHDSS